MLIEKCLRTFTIARVYVYECLQTFTMNLVKDISES